MSKLKQLPSQLQTLPPRLKPAPKIADALYTSPEWRKLIARIKRQRGNWCERCGSGNRVIGDHKHEIKDGGAPLDEHNIELLCINCHNTKTHRQRALRARGQT